MIPNFFKKRDNGCKKLENSRREGLNVLSKEVKLLEKVNQKWVFKKKIWRGNETFRR